MKHNQLDWYSNPTSDLVLEQEKHVLANLPLRLFRPNLLQLGGASDLDYSALFNFAVEKQIYLREDLHFPLNSLSYNVCGCYTELPFFSASIDIAVLFHILEFSKEPRHVLREIFDVLRPDGYAIVFGFNPFSLLALHRLTYGHYLSSKKLRTWLEDLGFQILDYQTFFFRPVLNSNRKLKKLRFLEGLGSMLYPSCGGIYAFLVQKKVAVLTPVKENLLDQFAKGMHITRSLIKPTARSRINEQ